MIVNHHSDCQGEGVGLQGVGARWDYVRNKDILSGNLYTHYLDWSDSFTKSVHLPKLMKLDI